MYSIKDRDSLNYKNNLREYDNSKRGFKNGS